MIPTFHDSCAVLSCQKSGIFSGKLYHPMVPFQIVTFGLLSFPCFLPGLGKCGAFCPVEGEAEFRLEDSSGLDCRNDTPTHCRPHTLVLWLLLFRYVQNWSRAETTARISASCAQVFGNPIQAFDKFHFNSSLLISWGFL